MTLYQYFISGGWKMIALAAMFAAGSFLVSHIFLEYVAKLENK
jgi:hypothetical protein